jgi:nitrate reductase NapE component
MTLAFVLFVLYCLAIVGAVFFLRWLAEKLDK